MTRGAFLVLAFLATPAPEAEAPASRVTRQSFKYLDEAGEVRFAPSWEQVPEAYRSPLRWRGQAWCADAPVASKVKQTVEPRDIDADGDDEVLVYFDDECPNGRRFAVLEVIEADADGGFSIVAVVNATRGNRPEPVDLDGDGRFEIVGRHHGGAPELWVRESAGYVDLIRGGTCFGTFWQLGMGKPGTPLEEILGRVLELYRDGECLREWLPGTPPGQVVRSTRDGREVLALVDWLRKNGIMLEKAERGWWKLTRPATPEEYDVVVSIRALGSASEEGMRRELAVINLGYLLNVGARLAISIPSVRGQKLEPEQLPRVDGLPVTEAILKLFGDYQGIPPP